MVLSFLFGSLLFVTFANAAMVFDKPSSAEVFHQANFKAHHALNDPERRIHKDFRVPKNLRYRTEFWFDVYTKYDSNTHVIHNSKYPWIIYEVVDTTRFLKGKGPRWLRVQRGEKYLAKRKKAIRQALEQLAAKKSYRKLNKLQTKLYRILKQVPGKRQKVFKQARWAVRSQLGQRDFFLSGLESSSLYLTQIEEVFSHHNLPTELTRIPFVESSFNVNAQSRVGASGIWQLMPRTAKQYLKVTRHIDERNSPIKASYAAARVLKNYYRAFKSWPLAITAYNHGIGNLRKAIRRTKSRSLGAIISRYQHKGAFKFASANFYTSFLAALHAKAYYREIFKQDTPQPQKPLQKVAYKLNRSLTLKALLKHTGLDMNTLKEYNLDLRKVIRKDLTIPRGFTLMVPKGSVQKLNKKLLRPVTLRLKKKPIT